MYITDNTARASLLLSVNDHNVKTIT